jgi:hypothetical protein
VNIKSRSIDDYSLSLSILILILILIRQRMKEGNREQGKGMLLVL